MAAFSLIEAFTGPTLGDYRFHHLGVDAPAITAVRRERLIAYVEGPTIEWIEPEPVPSGVPELLEWRT